MEQLTSRPVLTEPALSRVAWAFPAAITLHNLEEAIWLPAWSQHAGALHPAVGASEFRFAVGVITVAAYWITAAAVRSGRWAAAAAFWVAMLLNVVFPHLLATIVLRRYAPGLVTALALNLPVCSYLLRRVERDGLMTRGSVLRAAAVGVPVLLLSLPALFAIGRCLFGS